MVRASTIHRLRTKIRATFIDLYDGLFPTADEARLITILGGTVVTIGAFRRHGRQMTLILSRGRLLRSERFRRAALNGDGVLANDIQWAIKILGSSYEHDVVSAYELDEKMRADGWRVRNIPARWLYEKPDQVRAIVNGFIYA